MYDRPKYWSKPEPFSPFWGAYAPSRVPTGGGASRFTILWPTKWLGQRDNSLCSARARNTARGGACAPLFNCMVLAKSLAKLVFLAVIGVGFFPVAPGVRAQTLDQTRDKFLSGNYEDVIQIVRKRGNGDYDDSWRVLLVKSLMTLGRYAEARTNA